MNSIPLTIFKILLYTVVVVAAVVVAAVVAVVVAAAADVFVRFKKFLQSFVPLIDHQDTYFIG